MRTELTHVDEEGIPSMVDVTEEAVSARVAIAESHVQLPAALREFFRGEELHLKQGPVFHTAVIAGTMAVKKTHELIPFCHPLPIEGCKIEITVDESLRVTIRCRVRTASKTGVEMEALHGASVAALTIYDMCKAVSHEMVIQETRLLSKLGGKPTLPGRPLYGLVLTGGQSTRMNKEKALLSYHAKPHARYLHDLLKKHCREVYLSAREGQWRGSALECLPTIADVVENQGPMGGILSALRKHPDANWFVVACDLPFFGEEAAQKLLHAFDEKKVATCYQNSDEAFPEALCAIYTPAALPLFEAALAAGNRSPVKVLGIADCKRIEQTGAVNLMNANTPDDFTRARGINRANGLPSARDDSRGNR